MHPLLTFHTPTSGAEPKEIGGSAKIHTPGLSRQFQRHRKRLEQLYAQYIALQDSVSGLTPERVLVLEVAGDIENFVKALSKATGFTHLDQRVGEINEDKEVYQVTKKKQERKQEATTLYLTMSNLKGLEKLFGIWRRLGNGEDPKKFPAPLRHALTYLLDIRFWDTKGHRFPCRLS